MGLFSDFFRELPLYLLTLPVVLLALSVHESAHGYAAYKLGDPTARNLGRITLNPVKHFDLLGFISMMIFHIGWAKPVPISSRHFQNPRRDMAITGAAGPLSNLCLAIIHLVILRISMIFFADIFYDEVYEYYLSLTLSNAPQGFTGSLALTVVSLIVYMLYLGVVLNVVLAVFNLLPIPPFDGSRIFYAFLPPKLYFGVMKYERVIMLVVILLFFLGVLSGPLAIVEEWLINGLFSLVGMGRNSTDQSIMYVMIRYIQDLVML